MAIVNSKLFVYQRVAVFRGKFERPAKACERAWQPLHALRLLDRTPCRNGWFMGGRFRFSEIWGISLQHTCFFCVGHLSL